MAFMIIGYLLGLVLIPKYVSQRQALTASAVFGIILTIGILLSNNDSFAISSFLWGFMGIPVVPDPIALLGVLGLANAMVWPAVWPLALDGLGKLTARGSALLIMGISGGAILPMVYGVLAETIGSNTAYIMLIPCYGFILYYAMLGCKKRSW